MIKTLTTGHEKSPDVRTATSELSIFVCRFLEFLYIETDKLYTYNE